MTGVVVPSKAVLEIWKRVRDDAVDTEHGKSHTVSATCIAYSALLQEQEGCAVAQLVAMIGHRECADESGVNTKLIVCLVLPAPFKNSSPPASVLETQYGAGSRAQSQICLGALHKLYSRASSEPAGVIEKKNARVRTRPPFVREVRLTANYLLVLLIPGQLWGPPGLSKIGQHMSTAQICLRPARRQTMRPNKGDRCGLFHDGNWRTQWRDRNPLSEVPCNTLTPNLEVDIWEKTLHDDCMRLKSSGRAHRQDV
ncbi:hypothetical protein B0T26DRAFT_672465 [Lasiosphaeria miniovina]|uniref:Uncharacterized protein n=1 Tax=Lasiosphaeria miniovina TaxID=1954250 RepID=A0AA40E5G6_9PEZI|nr:uncharacterized protein B0T26DRAFT_672465 [Lasiosphaeria miniovina]KAK0727850.1 hypothetical protein B0T26DRAFT_672465 [Lasiosphaeria miniovina]